MRFAALDVYPKTLAEFRQRTTSGAIVSITCAALILLLTIVEVADFVMVTTDDHLFVDSTRGSTLRINLNISFPALPCSTLTLDTLDVSGNHAPDLMRHVTKSRLDKDGRRLTTVLEPHGGGDGAPGRRPLSVEHGPNLVPALRALRQDAMLSSLLALLQPQVFEDKAAIAELRTHVGEGCHIEGHMVVNRVAGNFHFALTHEEHTTLMAVFGQREALNVSHTIHSVSFGEPYPGMLNPLDARTKLLGHGSGYFQYYIKIVPTIYEPLRGEPLHTNQYSFNELFRTTKEVDKMPAVYFHYEISPIMAKFSEGRRSFTSFLTGLCAIVGGVFTVAGMCDSCLYRAMRSPSGGASPSR